MFGFLKKNKDESKAPAPKADSEILFEVKVMIQPTPNPNAFKFIVNREVKARGNTTFNSKDECGSVELASKLFDVPGVVQLYLFDNVITVTLDPNVDMMQTEDQIMQIIKDNILAHNPNFADQNEDLEKKRRENLSPELKQIEEILDRTIRPGLQGDGGDVEVLALDNNELTIRYQGACGSCPSSTMGTLMAIESILRDEFDPDISVTPL